MCKGQHCGPVIPVVPFLGLFSCLFCDLYIFVRISSLCNVFQTMQTFVVQCNLYQRIIPCIYNIEGEGAWRHVSKCPWRMKDSTKL